MGTVLNTETFAAVAEQECSDGSLVYDVVIQDRTGGVRLYATDEDNANAIARVINAGIIGFEAWHQRGEERTMIEKIRMLDRIPGKK